MVFEINKIIIKSMQFTINFKMKVKYNLHCNSKVTFFV